MQFPDKGRQNRRKQRQETDPVTSLSDMPTGLFCDASQESFQSVFPLKLGKAVALLLVIFSYKVPSRCLLHTAVSQPTADMLSHLLRDWILGSGVW